MDFRYLAVGLFAFLGGFYLRRHPNGRWNRFAAEHTAMFRDPDAEEKMALGAPVVGVLLMLGGLVVLAAGVLGV
jgi:hypothetical protein